MSLPISPYNLWNQNCNSPHYPEVQVYPWASPGFKHSPLDPSFITAGHSSATPAFHHNVFPTVVHSFWGACFGSALAMPTLSPSLSWLPFRLAPQTVQPPYQTAEERESPAASTAAARPQDRKFLGHSVPTLEWTLPKSNSASRAQLPNPIYLNLAI